MQNFTWEATPGRKLTLSGERPTTLMSLLDLGSHMNACQIINFTLQLPPYQTPCTILVLVLALPSNKAIFSCPMCTICRPKDAWKATISFTCIWCNTFATMGSHTHFQKSHILHLQISWSTKSKWIFKHTYSWTTSVATPKARIRMATMILWI